MDFFLDFPANLVFLFSILLLSGERFLFTGGVGGGDVGGSGGSGGGGGGGGGGGSGCCCGDGDVSRDATSSTYFIKILDAF